MANATSLPKAFQFILTAAAFVIVIAGIRAAETIVVPFVLAVFLAVAFAPLLFWLQSKGLSKLLSLFLVLLTMFGIGYGLFSFVGTSINQFTSPRTQQRYTQQIDKRLKEFQGWVAEKEMLEGFQAPLEALLSFRKGDDEIKEPRENKKEATPSSQEPSLDLTATDSKTTQSNQAAAPTNEGKPINLSQYLGSALGFAGSILAGLTALLTKTFLIFITVAFILLEASTIPAKLKVIVGDSNQSLEVFQRFKETVKRYIVIKTGVSMLTGTFVAVWVSIVGLDFPMVWGFLAFLLNFIPNIGSIIAAVPAVLLALIQPELGLGSAILTAGGYVGVNIFFGNIVEPRFMGQQVGLSTLIVFVSLVFWGWVLGPVGMLLSVPLTMTVKIALDMTEETRWISILLGSDAPDPSND